MNTQSKRFIWWLLAITLIIVGVAIYLSKSLQSTGFDPNENDLLQAL